MSTASTTQLEPAWEIALLFPYQGDWRESDYLSIANTHNRLVELSDGRIEVLPMPSPRHQKLVAFLYRLLFGFVTNQTIGTVLFAPLSVRLWEGKFREPDIVFMFTEHANREQEDHWSGADLAIEVVSPSNPDHDMITKRQEYAQAAIPEYWIVDPQTETITVLHLAGNHYVEYGIFHRGQMATSTLLQGFEVSVNAIFDVV
jgi:Uma2 family endonuclease